MADIEVVNNRERRRYEAIVEGVVAGISAYQLTDELIVFTHTEVGEEYEGEGVGGALVQGALDDVRLEGAHRVLPLCPFVKAWIGRHRDYQDLVYAARPSTARD